MWDSHTGTPSRRTVVAGLSASLLMGCKTYSRPSGGVLLHRAAFASLDDWLIEAEQRGRISAAGGVLDVDVPAGATLWLRRELRSPVTINYEITAVSQGGPNDHVSDLNAFWMASDPRSPSASVLDYRHSGSFGDYDELRTYYVGIGGNRNTTSRFRRYIGRKDERPLLPQHDLSAREYLIEPNRPYRMELIADGGRIEVRRDGALLFRLNDPQPYTRGHFGLRTTKNHLRVRDLTVWKLN